MMMNRCYSELMRLDNFDDRIEYLRLKGMVGESTFGSNRWINQEFYRSKKWRRIRDLVIMRDEGCDLGVEDYDIHDMILIHHINPITVDDIINDSDSLYDLENLICSSKTTHDYIHYGKKRFNNTLVIRSRNDTSPWLT